MKLFTPEDYVLARVGQYPTLYAAPTFEQAKLRVYDQLFNVIGNGIRDDDELRFDLKYHKFDRERALKFCNGAQALWGYKKVRDFGSGFKIGEGDSITAGDFEQDQYPDVIHWQESGFCKWNPYPNFSKRYSAIWFPNFREVAGDEWVAEAVWYYAKCREWFITNGSEYHGAYPTGNQAKDAQYLADMFKQRERYESDEAFSAAYNIEYTGDMVDFMTRRSAETIAKAIEYIDETIKEFG